MAIIMTETENTFEGSKVSLLPQSRRHREGVKSPEETQSQPPEHELLRPAVQCDGRKEGPAAGTASPARLPWPLREVRHAQTPSIRQRATWA